MKLILAGDTALYGPTDYKYFLYNCNLNKCQHSYTVPIPDLSKLQFFVYFGQTKPATMEFKLVSTCSPGCSWYLVTNNNPDPTPYSWQACNGAIVDAVIPVGENMIYAKDGTVFASAGITVVNLGNSETIIAQDYVVGQLPNGLFYGVFKNFTTPVDLIPSCFVITGMFTFGAEEDPDYSELRYFSEEICIENCGDLMEIKACFPEKATSLGFDINRIYYGFHNGAVADALGDIAVRYFHKYYVRQAYIINTGKRVTFKRNLSRNFRSFVELISQIRTELVPEWYSNYLLAAFTRGEIIVRETMSKLSKKWTLQETNFELIDEDAELWKPVVTLTEEFKQFFGCDECINGEHACLGNPTVYLRSNINPAKWTFTFLDGTLAAGESIEYEVRRKDNQNLIASGHVNALPGSFSVPVVDMDLDVDCFVVRWRKICETDAGSFSFDFSDDFEVGGAAGAFSEWNQKEEGNCDDDDDDTEEVACKTYEFEVFGSDDSQYTVKAILCDGSAYDSGPRLVGDGAHIPICAKEGTVEVTGNIVVSDSSADCEFNCYTYKITMGAEGPYSFTQCNGDPGGGIGLAFEEFYVCAREETVIAAGASSVARIGPCVG